ncbi:energy transducer TonB [Glaciecola sp. MF2-115]|uniref:energy transducer TonB n=1 Tax=Glaciecola sp. MF2-115 TaxID=3384827 RepID=UPI0039A1A4A9
MPNNTRLSRGTLRSNKKVLVCGSFIFLSPTLLNAQESGTDALTQAVNIKSTELSKQLSSYKEAEVKTKVPPKYPISAARKGYEGWASYSFSVDSEGSVKDIELVDSSGLRAFELEGKIALKRWKYVPATSNGEPVDSGNYRIQLDFRLDDNRNNGVTRSFKKRLTEAQKALDEGDLLKVKELIAEIDQKGQRNRNESFYFSMLEADYAAAIGDSLLEARSFRYAYSFLSNDWQEEKRRSYAFERMFKLYINTKQYKSALRVFEKAKDTSTDEALVADLQVVAVQVTSLLEDGAALARPGYIRDNYFWYHKLTYNTFSIIEVKGDIDELQLRCDLETTVYKFKPNNTWTIPESWGDCSVLLNGEADTTFTLVENRV